jgi:hypothetical protein
VSILELCGHCIAKRGTRRAVPFGEVRAFSGDTFQFNSSPGF